MAALETNLMDYMYAVENTVIILCASESYHTTHVYTVYTIF